MIILHKSMPQITFTYRSPFSS